MSGPTMVPDWIVLLVGRQALEIEDLRRRLEEKEKDRPEPRTPQSEPE